MNKNILFLILLIMMLKCSVAQIPTENLQLWLKADAGVTPNTNNAQVTLWTDQSGNNNSLVGTTGGFDGTGIYVVNGSEKYIQFPGASYLRKTSSVIWPANSTAVTIFVVHKGNMTATQSTSLFNLSTFVGFDLSQGIGFPGTQNGAVVFRNGSFTIPYSNGTSTQVGSVVFTANDANATACQTFKNGVLVNGSATVSSSLPATIGAITIGNLASGNGALRVYEVIAYSAALNESDRQTVESYLLGKYSSVLPLSLLNFRATEKSKTFLLEWQTENEINTSIFEVEKSSDGRNFTMMHSLEAKNASGVNYYSFIDGMVSGNDVFYRLKMIDINGGFTYSDIVKASAKQITPLNIFPNPASNIITLQGFTEKTEIRLIDTEGRQVIRQLVNTARQTLDIASLPKGLYILQYNDGEKILFQKIIKE